MLARDSILISLSPSSLRVALTSGGEVTRVERAVLDSINVEEAWAQALRPLDDALRAALRSLDVRKGAPAQVLYHSPRLMSEVFVAPTTGPAAMQAARMHLSQSLPEGGEGWATNILALLQVAEPGAGKRQVMLLTADTASNQNTLAQWLTRCGVRPVSIAPSKAILLQHVVSAAPETQDPMVRIQFDEHAMTLCGWSEGRMAFARCADVGYGLIIDAMRRAARSESGEVPSREYAARLLFSAGIPTRGQVLDPARKLTADAVMPLVQPALQRCIIEVRQTLRFGFPEQDIQRAGVRIEGAGASIPGIIKSFSDHLEIDLTSSRGDPGPHSGVADDQVGDLAVAVKRRNSDLWTVPPCERVRAENSRLTLCVRAGAAVAVLLLAAMWGSTRRASASVAGQLEEIAPRAAELQRVIGLRSDIDRDSKAVAQSCALIDTALGRHTSWLGALALVPQDSASDITILGVEGCQAKDAGGSPTLIVHGHVPEANADSPNGADHLTQFVEKLTTSPLIASARVVSVRADSMGSEFTIEAQLRSLPASLPLAAGEPRAERSKKP